MKVKTLSIKEIIKLNNSNKIDFNLELIDGIKSQRNVLHSGKGNLNFDRDSLMYSILMGYNIGSIMVADIDGVYSIIDGKQRLNAIISYLNDEYSLKIKNLEIDGFKISRKKFTDLTDSLIDSILKTKIVFIISDETDPKRILEQFVQSNKNGSKLTPIEILRASLSEKSLYLDEFLEHPFIKNIAPQLDNTRFQMQNMILELSMLAWSDSKNCNSTTGEKKKFIDKMVKDNESFELLKEKTKKYFDYMNEVFNRPEYLDYENNLFLSKKNKKVHVKTILSCVTSAKERNIAPLDFFNWAYDFFVRNKNESNDYWKEASAGSTSGKKLPEILQSEFNSYFN